LIRRSGSAAALQRNNKHFQWVPTSHGNFMQHERDIRAGGKALIVIAFD
jgi:hypothetical protein